MKKIISLLLALMLTCALCTSAFASEDGSTPDLEKLKEIAKSRPFVDTTINREQIQKENDESVEQIDENALLDFNGKNLAPPESQARAAKISESILEIIDGCDPETNGSELTKKLKELEDREGIKIDFEETDDIQFSFVIQGKTYRLMSDGEFVDKLNKIQDEINFCEQEILATKNQILSMNTPPDDKTLNELAQRIEDVNKAASEGLGLRGELLDQIDTSILGFAGVRYNSVSSTDGKSKVRNELDNDKSSLEKIQIQSKNLLKAVQMLKEDQSPENLEAVKLNLDNHEHNFNNGICTICGKVCENSFHSNTCPDCGMTNRSTATGSTLSEGNVTIVCTVAAAVVFGLSGFLLGRRKKPVPSNSMTGEDEE